MTQGSFVTTNILFPVIAGLIGGVLTVHFKELELRKQDKWNIKREACLVALDIADGVLSHTDWDNMDPKVKERMRKQEVDTVKVRECYNRLATSCDSPEV